MDVAFKNRKLEKLAANQKERVKKLGPENARRFQQRISELLAATCLEDLRHAPGRIHELKGDRKGQLSSDLVHPLRLIFVPTNQPPPRKEDGGLNWEEITTIEILEITDTHD